MKSQKTYAFGSVALLAATVALMSGCSADTQDAEAQAAAAAAVSTPSNRVTITRTYNVNYNFNERMKDAFGAGICAGEFVVDKNATKRFAVWSEKLALSNWGEFTGNFLTNPKPCATGEYDANFITELDFQPSSDSSSTTGSFFLPSTGDFVGTRSGDTAAVEFFDASIVDLRVVF